VPSSFLAKLLSVAFDGGATRDAGAALTKKGVRGDAPTRWSVRAGAVAATTRVRGRGLRDNITLWATPVVLLERPVRRAKPTRTWSVLNFVAR